MIFYNSKFKHVTKDISCEFDGKIKNHEKIKIKLANQNKIMK